MKAVIKKKSKRGLKIRKTVITSKKEISAKEVQKVIAKSRLITSAKIQKAETKLFQKYILERQSMKKAVAFLKWEKFVNEKTNQ